MPSVLKNFLIGVGMDTEDYDKGAKRVESSLGRMRSVVGFTGAAIAGAFAAAGVAAIGAGRRVDQFALATEKLRTSQQYVYDYGNAVRALGGSADEAAAAINTAESALASFRQTGQLPGLDDLAMAGVDVNALTQADTGQDFLRELARQMPELTKEQQLRVQEALGLSDAVMRSLRGGVDELDRAVARAHDLAGNLEGATEAARDFNRQLAEFDTRLEGVGNTLATNMLPALTGVLGAVNQFIDRNKDAITGTIEAAGESPGATAAAASGAALALPWAWRAARAVGLRAIPYAGFGYGAYQGLKDEPVGDWWNQSVDSARGSWRGLTGQNNVSDLPDAPYGPAVPDVGPGFDVRPLPVYSGGEVTPGEAAAANPDVVLIRDQRQQADKPAAPQRVDVQNHLDVKMELDGRALDNRITEVVERRERNTADDIISSVDR